MKFVYGYIVSIPEVRVLHISHRLIVLPLLKRKCTVRYEASLRSPSARVGAILISSLNRSLRNRHKYRECKKAHDVWARSVQLEGYRVIIRSRNIQLCRAILGIAIEYREEVCIIRSGLRIIGSLPGIYDVVCVQCRTI